LPQTSHRTSWWNDFLATVTAASGIGYLATAYAISRWLTRSSPAQPCAPNLGPLAACETLDCRTDDGLRLAGWAIAPDRPRGTVVIFHGLRGNRGHMLGRVAFLLEAGYRCVAFDHRAHGQSEGKKTSFGYWESRDVAAILDTVRTRWPGEPTAAMGVSRGAAALCFAGAQTHGLRAFILESLYHDIGEAFRTRVGRGYPPWFHRFSRGVIWICEKRLGLKLEDVSPLKVINRLDAPVLLMTGSDDPHAPPADMDKLAQRCREKSETLVIPGAAHSDIYDQGGEAYRTKVLDFLGRKCA
jgi:uncharacterized protein